MSVEVLGGLSSELPEGEIDCQRLRLINGNICLRSRPVSPNVVCGLVGRNVEI